MTGSMKLRGRLGAATAIAGVTVLVAACGSGGSTGGGANTSGATTSGSAAAPAVSATPVSDRLATLSIASTPDGSHLVGAGGRALYLWKGDTGSTSRCTGACAKAWPAVLASGGEPHAAAGVESDALATTSHGHGRRQVTYHGHPLYYFAGDSGGGTANGQGSDEFGAKWYLVTSAGTAITTTSGSSSSGSGAGSYGNAPTTSATTSSTSGGSSGGW